MAGNPYRQESIDCNSRRYAVSHVRETEQLPIIAVSGVVFVVVVFMVYRKFAQTLP